MKQTNCEVCYQESKYPLCQGMCDDCQLEILGHADFGNFPKRKPLTALQIDALGAEAEYDDQSLPQPTGHDAWLESQTDANEYGTGGSWH